MQVSATHTDVSDEDLQMKVRDILAEFPITRVTDYRVRDVMRRVDPEGVYARTLCNRAIVRRQYFVTYFNELWHLDTNLKLIR